MSEPQNVNTVRLQAVSLALRLASPPATVEELLETADKITAYITEGTPAIQAMRRDQEAKI
jgi:hypothetical protein